MLEGFFSRRSSAEYPLRSGDKENGTFSSFNEVSPSPGRRGPLGEAARVAVRAVKVVGACWRCKILRKKVRDLIKEQQSVH
jgi:hypothetical protein